MIQLRTPLYEVNRLKQTVDPDFLKIANKPCNRCDLSPVRNKACKQPVPPVGNLETAKMLILMQNPGDTENSHGIPACGPARTFINEFLKRGLTFDDFVLANALWCYTERGQKIGARHVNACRYNLSYLLTKGHFDLVVPVGDYALKMIEGQDARLDLRAGNPGHVTWFPDQNQKGDPVFKKCEFDDFPIYHPTHIDYLESDYGRVRARQDMFSHIDYIVAQYKNIKTGKKLELPYKHFTARTEEESHKWIDWLAENAEWLAIDFETWQLTHTPQGIFFSCSWAPWHSIGFWLYQCVDLPEDKYYMMKGNKNSKFEMKWELKDWHNEGSAKRIMAHFNDAIIQKKNRPYIFGQHVQIEMSCLDYFGIKLKPKFDDYSKPGAIIFDTMVGLRTVMQTQSVSMKVLMQKSMPLEASQKDWVDDVLTENEVFCTGYGLLARKPERPDDELIKIGLQYNDWQSMVREKGLTPAKARDACPLSQADLADIDKYWLERPAMLRHRLLEHRCKLDTDITGRLQDAYWKLALSGQALENLNSINLTRMEQLQGVNEDD